MSRRQYYDREILKYSKFLTPYNRLEDSETPLKYLIIERKISYDNNQVSYFFTTHNYDTANEFWGFISQQRTFQSSNKEKRVFIKEKVVDLDTGKEVTEYF